MSGSKQPASSAQAQCVVTNKSHDDENMDLLHKPGGKKPEATLSVPVNRENVHILPQTPQLIALLTMIRDANTGRADFIFYSNRIIRLIVEEGLNHLPVVDDRITTPTGRIYNGVKFQGKICGVSIMRAGEAMEQGLRDCCRSVRIGKILIQRDEESAVPKLFYQKLPADIEKRWVLLLDPMFATGGSASLAVDVLKEKGVPEERILFLNVLSNPLAIGEFALKYPKLRVVTAFVDEGLDEKKYIIPGLGDFGDRYYTL
ncbi:Uracil phosphoribosyltransferase, synthesizes UMP from uracil [Ascosphaera atra]|nr:Uracil phosphoribosyltransferase, synthesizes UMP from uracil [Ascosphaera atra]